ncbi:MAG: hypothetical protein OHK0015_52430 [Chloroflexi bacterium OHK40]
MKGPGPGSYQHQALKQVELRTQIPNPYGVSDQDKRALRSIACTLKSSARGTWKKPL